MKALIARDPIVWGSICWVPIFVNPQKRYSPKLGTPLLVL